MTNEEAKEYIYDCLDHSEATEVIKALEAQPTHGSTYGGVSWGETYKEEAQSTDAILREIMARIEHLHDAEDIKGHIREFIKENE